MRGQPVVYDTMERLGIACEGVEHKAVYTIEEMLEACAFPPDVEIAKNLFLRDAKGKRHFLVVLPKLKQANLDWVRDSIGSTRLSFASEERMVRHLGLTPGAVSPFGILNDASLAVEVVIDKELTAFPRLGLHPNDNTATVFLAPADLLRVIKEHGNTILWI